MAMQLMHSEKPEYFNDELKADNSGLNAIQKAVNAALNSITHPAVTAETKRLLREHAMQGGKIAAIDAIGLIGSGLDSLCDRTYAVLADRETRLRRIMSRDGLTRERAEQRLDAQPSDDFFITHCSDALLNDGTEESFHQLCKNKFLEVIRHG